MENQSSQILKFPFDGVGARIAALSAPATVVVVDRKVSAQFVGQRYVEPVVSQRPANNEALLTDPWVP
jgi:hypothetical protein